MKRIGVLCIFLGITFSVVAQQRPHYSQYLQNMSVINPAVTGLYQGLDFRLGLRTQWTGLAGAPKTGYFSFSTPFSLGGDMANYRGSDLGVVQPRDKDEMVDYTASMSHHALGTLILTDNTSPLNRLTFNANYAYHLEINDMLNLSAGLGIGFSRLSLNESMLRFEETGDPVVGQSAEINKFKPDLNFGLYLYGSSFYLGASMQQIIPNALSFDGTIGMGKDVAHYFVSGGYSFWINNYFWLSPSVMVKIVRPLPTAYDINFTAGYRDIAWIGTGYRKGDALFASAGFRVAERVDVGYNYDFTRSNLRTVSSGSHEITLRLLLKN